MEKSSEKAPVLCAMKDDAYIKEGTIVGGRDFP